MRLAPRTPSVVRLLPGSMAELKEASHRPKIIAPIVRANPYQNGGSLLRNDWRRFHGQITRNGINRFPNLDLRNHCRSCQCRQPSLSTSVLKPSGIRGAAPSSTMLQALQGHTGAAAVTAVRAFPGPSWMVLTNPASVCAQDAFHLAALVFAFPLIERPSRRARLMIASGSLRTMQQDRATLPGAQKLALMLTGPPGSCRQVTAH